MKKLFATFILTFALLVGVQFLSFAQESNTHQYGNGTLESQDGRDYEQPNPELEGTSTKLPLSKPDSILIKPSLKIKPSMEIQKPAKKADEDAVSFNFLYYIIQRFKSSDIIED